MPRGRAEEKSHTGIFWIGTKISITLTAVTRGPKRGKDLLILQTFLTFRATNLASTCFHFSTPSRPPYYLLAYYLGFTRHRVRQLSFESSIHRDVAFALIGRCANSAMEVRTNGSPRNVFAEMAYIVKLRRRIG